jgi:YVTN family beta-propeller protein
MYFTDNSLAVIATATKTVIATVPIGSESFSVAVTPDDSKVYVVNPAAGSVSAINAATNTVIARIPVGGFPIAYGIFIQPTPRFAGTPGKANCHGQSVSALARQYGGLDAAAAALGYSSVPVLQNAIAEHCAA